MAQKRATTRSRAGAKLYVKRSKTGQFTDIQSDKRAHGRDVKAEGGTTDVQDAPERHRGRRSRGMTIMRNVRPLLVALLLVPGVVIGIWIGSGSGQGAAPKPPTDAVQQAQTPQAVPSVRPEQQKTPHDQQDPGKTAPSAAASETQPDQGQGLGFDFSRDPLNAKRPMQTVEEIMKADVADEAQGDGGPAQAAREPLRPRRRSSIPRPRCRAASRCPSGRPPGWPTGIDLGPAGRA